MWKGAQMAVRVGIDDVTGELVVAKTPSTPSRPVDVMTIVL
jgi:hypothetical protein